VYIKSIIRRFIIIFIVLLKDIPSTGLDIWTDLKARSERSKVEGQLHLRLSLATREERDLPEDERQFETKQHCDLMTIFIDHELRKSKVSVSILPPLVAHCFRPVSVTVLKLLM